MTSTIERLKNGPMPGMLYQLHRVYLRFRRPFTLGVRAMVFDRDDAVLMVRHSYRQGWFFPGGGVAKWETLEQAAIRESAEEGGVAVERMDGLIGVFANFTVERCDHVALFWTRQWHRIPLRSLEIVEVRFFPLDAIPEDTNPATRRRIEEHLGRRQPDGYW